MSESSYDPSRRPPAISKPKLKEGQSVTHQMLEDTAFNHPYYLEKTGNWLNVKIGPILRTIKECSQSALLEVEADMDPYIKRFSDQGEPLQQRTYEIFLQRLDALSVDMSDEFYSVITDMLYSTLNLTSRRDKRWLWLWAMNERQKALQKLRQKKLQRVGDQGEPVDGDSPSTDAPGEDSFGSSDPEDSVQRRRRHLSIADLMNNNPE
ncbi:hypothetical protein TWF569_006721 [Orbilia oligospora]|uniref:Uncharacterized protein n=1 Tax=Orbilia oligospora TaxID=2813651 RepID=A0A7C8NB19_ORBOL|nr:hypothetical protein TWF102_005239 [Orbilia oligospora]KAF3101818.1 hypothetical protein TWF103_007814 [Orbilia oligospora]KAF3111757.1 hypothetical protein TWF706_011487 [Orbilia oligospora]KAF3133602.1 hypothetical protein TWF703_006659 [Orbilia oligospora]KAF3140101.1 hypothetical protein TWF594_006488 [Orbilia oligospora]